MGPVDIVIPHVDGAADGYEELCRRHTGDFVPCHLRDLGELRYVLRSICTFAPWARVVLVVQNKAHVPGWLRTNAVRVVQHAEFIPDDVLPTFHWATIVAHLYRIEGLAERYVVWEDDVLLGGQLSFEMLFGPNDVPRTDALAFPILPGVERIEALGTYQHNLANSRALLRRVCGPCACFVYPHMPLPVTRQLWSEQFDALIDDAVYCDTVTRKSRGEERRRPTVDPLVVFANWVQIRKRGRKTLPAYGTFLKQAVASSTRVARTYPVLNDVRQMKRNMARLLRDRARFINVNDEAYDAWGGSPSINPESIRLLHATLERLYPSPCDLERG